MRGCWFVRARASVRACTDGVLRAVHGEPLRRRADLALLRVARHHRDVPPRRGARHHWDHGRPGRAAQLARLALRRRMYDPKLAGFSFAQISLALTRLPCSLIRSSGLYFLGSA